VGFVNDPIFGFAGLINWIFLSCIKHRFLIENGQGGKLGQKGPPDKAKGSSVYWAFIGRAKAKGTRKGEGNGL
jgi:hypothetical protein